MELEEDWLDDYETVWTVGMHLAENKYGWGWAIMNLSHYFEKPNRNEDEYKEWREYMDWEMKEADETHNGYHYWLNEVVKKCI